MKKPDVCSLESDIVLKAPLFERALVAKKGGFTCIFTVFDGLHVKCTSLNEKHENAKM